MTKNGKSRLLTTQTETSNADSDVTHVAYHGRMITPDAKFLMGTTRVGKTNLMAAIRDHYVEKS